MRSLFNEKFFKLSFFVALIFAVSLCVPQRANAEGGSCGENANWSISGTTLTISGSGEVNDNPWWNSSTQYITNVVIENGITSLPYSAFANFTALSTVSIPNSVTSLGNSSFSGCTVLSSIELPEKITSISSQLFSGCNSLTSITIPEGVTTIGNYAFNYCTSLSTVMLPSTLESIGEGSFNRCSSLTSVNIPKSVVSIGIEAFAYCSNLSSVIMKEGVTSIGKGAFYHCEALTEISIPQTVKIINAEVFEGCKSLVSVSIPNEVSAIGNRAFYFCSSLPQIVIPNSVKTIGESSFAGDTSLSEITLSNSMTNIGNSAFSGCSSLIDISIPDKVTAIGNCAFYGCDALEKIKLPANLTRVSSGMLEHCKNLYSIEIPDKVTNIDSSAFECCFSLVAVNFPKSVSNIGYDAFWRTEALEHIHIPYGKKASDYIGKGALPNEAEKYIVLNADGSCPDPYCMYKHKHSYGTNYCSDATNHWLQCPVCGKKKDIEKHYLEESREYASLTKSGYHKEQCRICQKVTLYEQYEKAYIVYDETVKYTGKNLKPIKIVNSKGKTIDKSNYSITYYNNKKSGRASASIRFKNNYTGSEFVYFNIAKKNTIPAKISGLKVSAGKRQMKITWKKGNKLTDGYQIQYSTDKNFITGVKSSKISKVKTVKKTISKLKSGNSYYIRIRAYNKDKGKLIYSPWTATKKPVKIK